MVQKVQSQASTLSPLVLIEVPYSDLIFISRPRWWALVKFIGGLIKLKNYEK
jgi:hypothetical protein